MSTLTRQKRCRDSRESIRPDHSALVLTGRRGRTGDSSEHGDPPSPVQGLPAFFIDYALGAVHETEVGVLLVAQSSTQISTRTERTMTRYSPNNVFLLAGVLGVLRRLDGIVLDFLFHRIVFGGRVVALDGKLRGHHLERADDDGTEHLD